MSWTFGNISRRMELGWHSECAAGCQSDKLEQRLATGIALGDHTFSAIVRTATSRKVDDSRETVMASENMERMRFSAMPASPLRHIFQQSWRKLHSASSAARTCPASVEWFRIHDFPQLVFSFESTFTKAGTSRAVAAARSAIDRVGRSSALQCRPHPNG